MGLLNRGRRFVPPGAGARGGWLVSAHAACSGHAAATCLMMTIRSGTARSLAAPGNRHRDRDRSSPRIDVRD